MLPPSIWSLPRLSVIRGSLSHARSLGRLLLPRRATDQWCLYHQLNCLEDLEELIEDLNWLIEDGSRSLPVWRAKLNRRQASPSPWSIPLVVAKGPESFPSIFTWQVTLAIVIVTRLISLVGIPKDVIASYSFTLAMLSYALKSMKRWYMSCLYSAIFS